MRRVDPQIGGMTDGRVEITDEDVRAARRAWAAARDQDEHSARTAQLYDGYRRIVSAQAQQIADDFRRGRSDR